MTARLVLQPLRPRQARTVRALLNDPDVGRYLCDGKAVSLAWTKELIATSSRRFQSQGAGLWSVRPREWWRPVIGIAGVTQLEDGVDPEILFAFRPGSWGQGLAREASEALIDYFFTSLGWERLRGATDAPNVKSARLLERLGMRYVGQRDGATGPLIDFELTRKDWQASR